MIHSIAVAVGYLWLTFVAGLAVVLVGAQLVGWIRREWFWRQVSRGLERERRSQA